MVAIEPLRWEEVPGRRVEVGPMCATWTDLGKAGGSVDHRPQAHPDRAGPALDAGPRARRRGGDLLRPRRRRSQLAGRRDLRGDGRLLHRPRRRRRGAHADRRRQRPGRARLRHAPRGPGRSPAARRRVLARAGAGSRSAANRTPGVARWRPASWWSPSPASARRTWSSGAAVDEVEIAHGDTHRKERALGRAGGSRATGLNHVFVAPNRLNCPPHVHAAEEEIFLVLDGDGHPACSTTATRGRRRRRRLYSR